MEAANFHNNSSHSSTGSHFEGEKKSNAKSFTTTKCHRTHLLLAAVNTSISNLR